jgi:hypothetical protein
VVGALAEGASIGGIERMTGVNPNTIMSSLRVGDGRETRYVIVLEWPPVESPKAVVQVSILNDIKNRKESGLNKDA